MISASADLDWYKVPQGLWVPLRLQGEPGLRVKHSSFQVHRTHLPIIDHLDAARFCTPPTLDEQARAAIDLQTAALGFKMRAHQHAAREFAVQRRGVLIADEPRVGKGQPLSAKVLTPSGWRLMGELQEGDAVIDPDGGVACVLGVYPQGVKRVYRVTTTDGAVTECDEEHLWLVQTSRREWADLPPRVIPLKDLLDGVRLKETARAKSGKPPARWILPLTRPVELRPQHSDKTPINAYVLGVLLGDGCLRTSVSVTNASEEIAVALQTEAERWGCQLRSKKINNTFDHRIVGVTGKANPLLDTLNDLGLRGVYSHEKRVPRAYLSASIAQRRALLAGLLDTDGEVTSNGTTLYTTTSQRLRDDVIELVRSLGGIAWSSTKAAPRYRYRGTSRVGRTCFIVTICLPGNPFRLKRKAEKWRAPQRRRKIASIEYLRDEETRCIRVSSKRSLYITDDYIVTHNTLEALMSHDWSLGRLVVIAPLMVRETWLGWIRRVFPGEDVGVMTGKVFDRALASKPIVFGHYSILKAWASDVPIGTLIFDEIHELSNPKSQRATGAAMLASRAQRVIGLTGTPIWNQPIGMWAILSLLAPGAFGDRHSYGVRYCNGQPSAHGWIYKGATNSEALDRRLSQIKIRRMHRDVQDDLPPISRDVIVADVSDVQRRKLDFAADALRKSDNTNTAGQLARYRAVLFAVKLDITVDRIKSVINNGEPLVVWTWHKSAANKIHERLDAEGVPVFVVHGDIAPAKREERMIAWKAHPNAALVITIATGMVGIDLSHSKRALVVEIDYTPALMEQMEKRTYDPTRPMYITYVVADHLSDRRVVEALSGKLGSSRPLGLTAAEGAIDLLHELFSGAKNDNADMSRLMAGLLEIEEAA